MPEQIDFTSLKDVEARDLYFEQVLNGGLGAGSPQQSLDSLRLYVDFTTEQLVDVAGFDVEDAEKTAAETVLGGLAEVMRLIGDNKMLARLDEIDDLIRKEFDIDRRRYPRVHKNHFVESFFVKLEPHLQRANPSDRF